MDRKTKILNNGGLLFLVMMEMYRSTGSELISKMWTIDGLQNVSTLDNSIGIYTNMSTKIRCLSACSKTAQCVTVAYTPATQTCHLYSVHPASFTNTLQTDNTTVLYTSDCSKPEYSFVPSANICVRLSQSAKIYSDARSDCQAENADLVMITSKELMLELVNLAMMSEANELVRRYWIGASRGNKTTLQSALNFYWINGEQLTSTNGNYFWLSGEPNSLTEACVEVKLRSEATGFNDKECYEPLRFICKMNTT